MVFANHSLKDDKKLTSQEKLHYISPNFKVAILLHLLNMINSKFFSWITDSSTKNNSRLGRNTYSLRHLVS